MIAWCDIYTLIAPITKTKILSFVIIYFSICVFICIIKLRQYSFSCKNYNLWYLNIYGSSRLFVNIKVVSYNILILQVTFMFETYEKILIITSQFY